MKKKFSKFKTVLLGAAAISTSLLIGMAAACSSETPKEEEPETTVTKQDSQVIKNGNFEFYKDNDGLFPISSPDNWSFSTNGNPSSSMSGIINTRKDRWDYITDIELPKKLEENDDLNSDDEKKVNYNGALTDDLPFADPHDATKVKHEFKKEDYIANPFTHEYSYDGDTVKNSKGESVATYKDEDGNYFLDEALTIPFETSVLMIHNYRNSSDYYGTMCSYTSSTSVKLEAGTACDISLWVKTSDLYWGGDKNERTPVSFGLGAYIKVGSSVGGNKISDDFIIKNIDTEQLNAGNETVENNGWVQYTIYVEASNFADTDVTLTLGLGSNNSVEGYAFFDDITFTKYLSNTAMHEKIDGENEGYFNRLVKDTTVNPLDDLNDQRFEYRVDKERAATDDGNGNLAENGWSDDHFFANRHFLIDFSDTESATDDNSVKLNENSVSAALTVDETTTGNFVCAKPEGATYSSHNIGALANGAASANLPSKLGNAIPVSDDIVSTLNISNDENWSFPYETFDSNKKLDATLTKALKSATKLPGVDNSTSAVFIFSAYGAAYEAHISDGKTQDNCFTIESDTYLLLSFWVKTSDMKGSTGATVTVSDIDGEKTSSFSIDSTKSGAVNIDGTEDGLVKDVFDGWVRCFIRVSNESAEAQKFIIKFNFGNTAIRGTTDSAYQNGWASLANLSVEQLSKDVFGYSSNVANCATIKYEKIESDTSHNFDSVKDNKNTIETTLALPSSYTGVNGASTRIIPIGSDSAHTKYDNPNSNEYSGLLNRNYVDNYLKLLNDEENKGNWFSALAAACNINGETPEAEVWKKITGSDTVVQPLIIVNAVRAFSEETGKIYNYGYYGSNITLSADAYTSVSVRVKASAGSVATVYLVDDSSKHNVLSYDTPAYTFWYDDNGNVLKGEPDSEWTTTQKKENIAYTLRKDGLYEKDGVLYANFLNLSTFVNKYESEAEHAQYYTKDGKAVGVDKAVENNFITFERAIAENAICYADEAMTAYAPHYLVAGNAENNKVYKYCSGLGMDATYYYMESGKPNTDKVVRLFNTEYAKPRYTPKTETENDNSKYQFTIDTIANPEYADKWVTVTFNVHTGKASKIYRLELWSGYRDSQTTEGVTENSFVMFDYNNISLDESTYNGWLSEYTGAIENDFNKTIIDRYNAGTIDSLPDNDANLKELEECAGGKSSLYDYSYQYFTYSLYDSADFIPFNSTTAKEGETGYSYSYSDYEESLSLFKIKDSANLSMTAFIDYSLIDKDIDIIGAPTVDNGDEESTTTKKDTNVWLLAASIALVAAIIVALLAIFVKDLLKKHHRKGKVAKNSYNFKKNKRYVKKYVKANGETPEVEEGNLDKSLLSDEQPEDEVEEIAANEETVEEAPAEEVVEEQPAEAAPEEEPSVEQPEEEAKTEEPAEDKPEDGENKE